MLSSSITNGVGNTWYVSENGTDKATIGSVNPRYGSTTGANAWGKTPTTAFATLKYALNFAQAEDLIFVEPGVYTEEFPLTVPVDVTIKGRGIKSVFIQPTIGTNDQDAFLIQGNCNIEDLTVRNFYYNDTNDTGYGFRLASGFTITERRPYIQRVSVITKGSVTSVSDPRGYNEGDAGRGALIDGSVANPSTIEASLLFNECTFVVPNAVGLYLKNGARCEWLNSFTYYALDGILGESPDGGTGLGGVARTRLNLQGEAGDFSAGSGNQVGLVEEGASNVSAAYTTSGADDLLSMTIASSAHGLSQGDLLYINTTSGGQSGLTQFRKILTATTNSFTIDGVFAGIASAGNLTYVKVSGFGTIDENDGTYVYLDGKGEGRFIPTDETTGKNVAANGNVVTSTTQFKFGTSSAFFDGVGDWLSIPSDPDFNFSTGDFTLEAFVRLTNTSGNKIIFDFRTSSLTEISPVVYISGSDVLYYVNGAAAITGAAAVSPTTWHHIAVSRTAGVSKLFVDGSQVGTSYTDGNDFPTRGLRIGADLQGSSSMNGYIDEVRITKGSSRYNANFTPTTTQFLADNDTALLLHMEGANNDAVFVDDSIVAQDVRTTAGGTATFVTLADYTKFGAELRSISSANVYGERGATANGQGVSLRLVSHNFGYIGVGKDDNNDVSLVIQSNEVIEQNNGRVFFTSIDQSGDFRVGDLFLVDQEKGTLSFAGSGGAGAGAGTSFDQLLVSSGSDTTTILPTSIEVGAFTFFGNTVSTTSGNINLTPFTGGEINFNQRVNLETFISGSTRLSLAFDGDPDTGIRKQIDLGDGFYDLVSNGGSVLRIAPGEVRALTDINISSSIPETISVGTPGTGYTVGTFTDIPVSGGSGTGLRADVVVTAFAGQVTQAGSGYVAGTFTNIPFINVQGQNQQTGTGTGGTGTVTVKGIDGGSISGGSGYTDNTYGDIPLNGGSGTGARASLTVSGGVVTDVNITNNGDSGYVSGETLTVNNSDLIYFDTEGNQLQSGGAGFAYTVPADSYTVTNVTPSGSWSGTGYQIGDAVTGTIPGGGSGFVFEFSNITFLSSANIVDEGEETAVTGEGYLTGELITPALELRTNDTLAGIGTTVTYNVQVRPKSAGGGNAFWINVGGTYTEAPALTLNKDTLYRFVFAPNGTYPGTFIENPFRFSETSDGTNTPGGVEYTTLAGALNANNGAYIIVTGDTPATLYYYSSINIGMGGSVDTSADTEYGQGGQLAIGSAILENFLALSKQGNITAEGGIFNTNLTVNENFAALGQTTLTSVSVQNLTVSGVLTATGGIGTQGNLTVQGDLGTNGALTVLGSPDNSSTINGSVEFDTDLLQIDATNNKVSIFGPTSPIEIEDYAFEVNSTAKIYNHVFLATDANSVVSIGNDPGSLNISSTFDEKFTVVGDSRFDGRILVNDGTELAPSITFDSDEKLGFYKSAENEITTVGYNGPIMKQTTQQISFFKPVDLINKAIDEYTIIPGRGYTVGTYNTVLFRGGTGADFTANVTVAFTGNITQPGSGYYNEEFLNVPVQYVNVSPGAITVLGTLTPGSNYVDGTYANVSLTNGSGAGATGDFVVENGGVTSVTINSRGSNYAVSDLLNVDTADIGGSKLSGSLSVDLAGSGYPDGAYTDVELINSTGSGSGATANITVSNGVVSAAIVNQGGGGYTLGDAFTVADSDLYENLTFNYTVTNNGSTNYVISGDDRNTTHSSASNPSINVNLGDIISFSVSATGHPFYLVSQLDPTTGGFNAAYLLPATNNGAENGTVSFDTALTVPGTYYYICENHSTMVGTIIVGSVTYGSGAAFSPQTLTTGSGFSIRVNSIGATGTGSGAQVRILVEGGVVTEFNITSPGTGYLVGDVLTVDYTDMQYADPATGQLTTITAPAVPVEYTVKRLNSVSYVNITDLGAGYSVDDVLDLPNDFYDATALGLTLFPTDAPVSQDQEFYSGEYAYIVTTSGTTGSVIPSFGKDGVSGIITNSSGSGYPTNATIERVQCEAITGEGTGLLVDIVTNGSGGVTSITPSGNLSGDLFQVGDQFTLDNDYINTGIASAAITTGGDNGAYGDTQIYDLSQTGTSGTGANAVIRFTSNSNGDIASIAILSNGIGYEVGEILEFDGSLFGGGGGGGEEIGEITDDPTTILVVVNSLTNGSGAAFTVQSIASSVANGTATISHNGYFPAGFSLTVNTLAEYNNIQFDAVDGVVTAKKLVASPDGIEISTTLVLNNNTISTTAGNLTLNSEANSQVVIGGSGALALPVGNDANRPGGPLQGSVRYNTDRNQFEGYNGNYFVSLGGVRDVDGNTYIVGEKFPGSDDNNIWFYNDGTQTLRVSQTELNLDTLNTINSNSYGTAEAWIPETAVTQFIADEEGNDIQQYVYSGDNVYSIDNDGTFGTAAPTHTTGTVINGDVNLTWLAYRYDDLNVNVDNVNINVNGKFTLGTNQLEISSSATDEIIKTDRDALTLGFEPSSSDSYQLLKLTNGGALQINRGFSSTADNYLTVLDANLQKLELANTKIFTQTSNLDAATGNIVSATMFPWTEAWSGKFMVEIEEQFPIPDPYPRKQYSEISYLVKGNGQDILYTENNKLYTDVPLADIEADLSGSNIQVRITELGSATDTYVPVASQRSLTDSISSTFFTQNISSVIDTNADRIVIYANDAVNRNIGGFKVGNVNHDSIIFGTQIPLTSTGDCDSASIAYDSTSNRIVWAAESGQYIVGEITPGNSSINFGSLASFTTDTISATSPETSRSARTCKILKVNGQMVIVYQNSLGGVNEVHGTVTGGAVNTVSWSTPTQIQAGVGLQDAFTDGTYLYVNYTTGVLVKYEVDTLVTNTGVVASIGGGTNVKWSVYGTDRVLKMYYNTGTSEIQARYYDLSDLSLVGTAVSTGIDSEIFSVTNDSDGKFFFLAGLVYDGTNDNEQNIQAVITVDNDDLNYTSRSRTYAALDQPININGNLSTTGDSDVIFVGTRVDGGGGLHDIFVTTASTTSTVIGDNDETVSFASAIENRTTYNIKIVSQTVKR
jgi:plastocyanin